MINPKTSDVVGDDTVSINNTNIKTIILSKGEFHSKITGENDRKGHRYTGVLSQIFSKLSHLIYRRETFIILVFDLANRPLPSPKPAEQVTIRLLTNDDVSHFLELWSDQKVLKKARFKQRMADGYIGIGTWHEKKLIGVNWLAQNKDQDSLTNLRVVLNPGSCFALDLQEHADFRGHRIGLATLSYSLQEAKRRGFKHQYICVSEHNMRMLAGAKYLMGYKQVGEIKTTYWFSHPFSRWKLGSKESREKTIVLGE